MPRRDIQAVLCMIPCWVLACVAAVDAVLQYIEEGCDVQAIDVPLEVYVFVMDALEGYVYVPYNVITLYSW